MMASSWAAWRWDHLTLGWVAWILFFAGWEAYSLIWFKGNELTAHLRPVFQSVDLAWFLALGLWIWVGKHFLVDGVFYPV
jgi:hypothetical protein